MTAGARSANLRNRWVMFEPFSNPPGWSELLGSVAKQVFAHEEWTKEPSANKTPPLLLIISNGQPTSALEKWRARAGVHPFADADGEIAGIWYEKHSLLAEIVLINVLGLPWDRPGVSALRLFALHAKKDAAALAAVDSSG